MSLPLSRTGRTPSFIVAEVSLKRKVIAFFAKILRCIPIHRPRDVAIPGEGNVSSDQNKVWGSGTKFTSSVSVGDELIVHQRPDFRFASLCAYHRWLDSQDSYLCIGGR